MLPYLIAGAIGFVVGKLLEEDEAPKYADGGEINYGSPKVNMSDIPFIHETTKEIADKILKEGFIVSKNDNITKGVYTIPIVYKKEPFNGQEIEIEVLLKPNSKIFWTNTKRPNDFYYGVGNNFFNDLFIKLGGNINDNNRIVFLRNMEKWLSNNGYCGVQQGGEIVITDLSCIESIQQFERHNPDIQYAGGGMLLAPNGKPSNLTPEQYKLVRTPEFKAWFGDWENNPANASKIVDENGEPLVVYHGSKSNEEFNVFKQSSRFEFIYFAKTKEYAWFHFTKGIIDKPFQLRPFFLNIRNLLNGEEYGFEKVDFSELKSFFYGIHELSKDIQLNPKSQYRFWEVLRFSNDIYDSLKNQDYYDGISFYENFYDNTTWNDTDDYSLSYVVMNPNQIKLADGSNTTFDGSNPDIRFEGGGEIESVIEQVKLEVDLSYYKQNIQYHSLYPKLKNLNFFDDDEKVTSILVKGFINDVKAKSELVNGKIRLYRALAIKNIEKLNVEKLGIYWSVNEDKTGVFDDEGYEHKEKPNYKSVFIICAEFNTKDIDWQNSFDLYVMNDWMEGEIRVVDGSEAYNLKIKKSGDKKWLNI